MRFLLVALIFIGCVVGEDDKGKGSEPSGTQHTTVYSVIDGPTLGMMPTKDYESAYHRAPAFHLRLPEIIDVASGSAVDGDYLIFDNSETLCRYNYDSAVGKFKFVSCDDGSSRYQENKTCIYLRVFTSNAVTVLANIEIINF